ncbi:hypothetical protein ACFPOI_30380 [Nonomuraea angiospora]|uniref:Phenylacetate-coenzyme A ligase PaaK-like adenylate-forming protein n=1 Tax=Nonomuraea angiospora TaxID=46172 RepID=A0ABR9LWE1_9ACTN|nr:hypothetical protein [Nonomuraea angiospora]MBE1584381.1 phenylacetate-coenzyme A ligase PaaK-like adenylate-forming protein [Nonomuraea angiospora]
MTVHSWQQRLDPLASDNDAMAETTHLPDYDADDPAVLRLPYRDMRRLQGERLALMAGYAYERLPFWRRKLDRAGVRPEEVVDARDVPRLRAIPGHPRPE